MSELNLPTCPICQAQDSLSRQAMDRAGKSFTWYQCQECGSVLLWLGDDRWAYQKIGREDQTHLLQQPLTVAELQALADVPDESQAAPAPPLVVVPAEEADESPVAPASPELAVPTEEADELPVTTAPPVVAIPAEEPGAAPGPPTPVREKERKGPSRWLLLALAIVCLCLVCAVGGLLVASQLGY